MKKEIVYVSLFIIFCSYVFADCTPLNNASLIHYYSFDNEDYRDDEGSSDLTNVGGDIVTNSNCIIDSCVYYDGVDDRLTTENISDATGSYTFVAWVKSVNFRTSSYLFDFETGRGGGSYNFDDAGDNLGVYTDNWYDYGAEPTTGVLQMISFTYDGTNGCAYINGSAVGSCQATGGFNLGATAGIGNRYAQLTTWQNIDGYFDEVMIFTGKMAVEDQALLYNDGEGCNPLTGGTPGVEPSLTISSDLVNSTVSNQSYWNFFFNGTSVNNSDIYNCDFMVNDVVNESQVSLNLSKQQNFTINFTYSEYWINLSINCSNENASDIDSAWYFIDDIQPLPVISVTNNTQYYDDTNLDISVNCSDENLFAINTTIRDSTNSLEFHQLDENILTSFFQQNITNSTSTLGVDTYTLETYCWDSHTSLNLKYKPEIDDDGIWYNGIRFYCDNVKKYEYKEKRDRVKFKVKFLTKERHHVCYFEGSDFQYISDSVYPNHYVSLTKKVWVDDYTATSNLINGKIQLEYWLQDETDEIITDSIGDLNEAYETVNFAIIAAPDMDDLYYPSFNESLASINANVEDIEEGIELIAMVVLWLGLWIFGFAAIQMFNDFVGFVMIMSTIPIDIYFWYRFQESLMTGTGWIGVSMGLMIMWTLASVFFIKKKTLKKKYS